MLPRVLKLSTLTVVEPMKDASEDEQVEDFINEVKVGAKLSNPKSEREERLRKMMDDEGRRVKAEADSLS